MVAKHLPKGFISKSEAYRHGNSFLFLYNYFGSSYFQQSNVAARTNDGDNNSSNDNGNNADTDTNDNSESEQVSVESTNGNGSSEPGSGESESNESESDESESGSAYASKSQSSKKSMNQKANPKTTTQNNKIPKNASQIGEADCCEAEDVMAATDADNKTTYVVSDNSSNIQSVAVPKKLVEVS
ncbi:cell cycle control protein [Reticulomyxa filosa]|uniref:Cell cycle control protein n=1 Tax=Reticulomyxa filosa TaxID=46433 RepID=X6N078_RETFI|nr:cell cycle control protein [Reticulomyxa filosa]|eukprot:ETO19685.1 cell cycle control protein [Reticulomyxa filosa]